MFETDRLLLRPFDLETDVHTLIQWQNDSNFITPMTRLPVVGQTTEAVREFWKPRAWNSLPIFAICLKPATSPLTIGPNESYFKACGSPIGCIDFQNDGFDFKNRVVSIGLGFGRREHRGQGYGREVLQWALQYAFLELGLHKVQLSVYSFNEAGIKLYRKVGFVEEGTQRKVYFKSGEWYDSIFMGILEEEWFHHRQELQSTEAASKSQGR